MTDSLRTRIIAALTKEDQLRVCKLSDADIRFMADAVIRELVGLTRRCERCRHDKPLTDFPTPHKPGGSMRPFCIPCTNYIEWTTS